MQSHSHNHSDWKPINAKRIAKSVSFILILVLVSSSGIEAIVKQQQQQQQSQQSRSDDSSAYNINHQSQQQQQQQQSVPSQQQQQQAASGPQNYGPQAASPPATISVSSSISSSSSSSSNIGQQQGRNGAMQMDPINAGGYQSASAPGQQKPSSSSGPSASSYMDSMSAAASNPEQSYQAAAQSVNMALANSGIYNSASNGFQPANTNGAANQQQQQQSSQSAPGSSASSLNPLHYFYYPAKDVPSSVGQAQPKSGQDNNQFMSNSYGPSYADQLSSALSSLNGNSASSPEAAASNQDASYLPQPMDGQNQNNQMYSSAGNNPQQQQQQQPNPQQIGAGAQQAQNNQFNGDLSSYASNQNVAGQQQQASSISFNGPTAMSNGQQVGGLNSNNNYQPMQGDFMNSIGSIGQPNQMNGNQQQPQQQQQQQQGAMPSYPNSNLFNGLGDLSTSNFGNNGGLSSIASYMPPTGSAQHDLFANSFNQQFNSAASQLNPAAVAPPQQQNAPSQSGNGHSSIFGGAASSLFGGGASASQQHQQQPSGGNLFSGQNYLSSFLTPQQLSQLAAANGQQSQQELGAASNVAASTAVAPSQPAAASSGKRFGISSFIMPMLALAGLSLLIPTMSNIGTAVGRKKRSIVEDKASASNRQQQIAYDSINGSSQIAKETSIGEYLDKIERYYSIYKNAVESDDCLNRLICEFGDAVKDITGKSAVVTVIEKLVPNWMTGKMHLFKEAALDNKEGKEKCKKYVCHSSRVH